jgi:hypothetical protein
VRELAVKNSILAPRLSLGAFLMRRKGKTKQQKEFLRKAAKKIFWQRPLQNARIVL